MTLTDFRSKKIFWAEPRAFKVKWVANFRISNFLLLPHNFATNQRPHSKFPHPTPRVAYQCPYAKEIRWIGSKMTELEPFLWRRSKFLKTSLSRRIAIFDVLAEILISMVRAQFWADWPQFFFCSSIITYILGWYTALPLNPDFYTFYTLFTDELPEVEHYHPNRQETFQEENPLIFNVKC